MTRKRTKTMRFPQNSSNNSEFPHVVGTGKTNIKTRTKQTIWRFSSCVEEFQNLEFINFRFYCSIKPCNYPLRLYKTLIRNKQIIFLNTVEKFRRILVWDAKVALYFGSNQANSLRRFATVCATIEQAWLSVVRYSSRWLDEPMFSSSLRYVASRAKRIISASSSKEKAIWILIFFTLFESALLIFQQRMKWNRAMCRQWNRSRIKF